MTMWKITSGRGSRLTKQFVENNLVAVGLDDETDFTSVSNRDEMRQLVARRVPTLTEKQVIVAGSQLWRFLDELKMGDEVLVYEPDTRNYHFGEIRGKARFELGLMPDLPVVRSVVWQSEVARDALETTTKNSLGAVLTLFKVPADAEADVRKVISGNKTKAEPTNIEDIETDAAFDPFSDIEGLALERIKDRINALSWDDMQELVAALLRALGYRTSVSAAGPDRGKDIIASRDGFGFERPRIVVEVKHRRGQMGSQEIRSFLGGRHADDRGLYVSTGGFTKDAHYEAERASTVTHLMSLDELAKVLIEQYDRLDEEGRRLLPLTKIYWPA